MSIASSAYGVARDVHRQMLRILAWLVGLAMVVALGLQWLSVRETVQQVALQQAAEQGRRIVAGLERGGPGTARREALLQAYFDEGQLLRLELFEADGTASFVRQVEAVEASGLEALDRLWRPQPPVLDLPLRAREGAAGGGHLRLASVAADPGPMLWQHLRNLALAMAAAMGVLLLLGVWGLAALRHHISALSQRIAESQLAESTLESVQESILETIFEPRAQVLAARKAGKGQRSAASGPVAATVVRSEKSSRPAANDAEIKRLRSDLNTRSEELERLRREAYLDRLTGLPRRQHFMARLEMALEGSSAWPVSTVLLLRVRDLAGVNQRVGHEVANRALRALAQALQTALREQGLEGTLAGRLNGADFALLLPRSGGSLQLAEKLLETVRRAWASLDPEGGLAIGVVELPSPAGVKQALALLDEALSRAEGEGSFAVAAARHGLDQHAFGSAAWQSKLADALARQRAVLAEYPVCNAKGELLYLDCPMRVQLDDGGSYESAWRWLAPAARGRYGKELDLLALQMALGAIGQDGRARCINLSAQAMESSAFVAAVTRELRTWSESARQLWIDLPEVMAADRPAVMQDAARQWRPLGVRLALEHAGERLGRIEHLDALGLDCVRVEGSFLRGLTGPDSAHARRHLQSIVQVVHVAGLSITAEGVANAGDLSMVWAMGFDAATGPAVQARLQVRPPQRALPPI